MGSMNIVEDIRGNRSGSCRMCAVRTVPYEWATTLTREICRDARMRDMARQLAWRPRGGAVICMLMGRNSIIMMPISGSWATRSEKKRDIWP